MNNVSKVAKYLDSKMLKENDDVHGEGGMVIAQLKKIHHQAGELLEMIKPEDNFEGWVQNKIDLAEDYIGVVHDRLVYREKEVSPEAEKEGY